MQHYNTSSVASDLSVNEHVTIQLDQSRLVSTFDHFTGSEHFQFLTS